MFGLRLLAGVPSARSHWLNPWTGLNLRWKKQNHREWLDPMRYNGFEGSEYSLRDLLARDRTILANERTLLAYVRTTIMLLVSSVSLLKLFPDSPLAQIAGLTLIPLAVCMAILGTRRFFLFSRSLGKLK